jgi:orotidine-5'-phosphate decarboxylase
MISADRIVVAMDILDVPKVLDLTEKMQPLGVNWFKVGLSLWIYDGQTVVQELKARGANVFLDLKLHDIPHQVGLATHAAADLGVDLLTIHASGGPEMMKAAVDNAGDHTRLLAITVLTSLPAAPGEVLRRAVSAYEAGVHGIVCSPLEVEEVRSYIAPPFLLVTPGVRPAGSAPGDQKRVATPEDAIASGSDLLVIGRPITQAADPVAAVRSMTT